MANMVKTVGSYGIDKNILIGQESYYLALPVRVSGEANGVILAGEPLTGDLTARDTAFTASTAGAVGINLHNVKLDEDGKGNATLVIAGCVDALKVETSVAANLKTAALEKIIVVKGSAY